MRFLGLEIKSDNMLKSKSIKLVVTNMLLNYKYFTHN